MSAIFIIDPVSPERVRANAYFLGRIMYAYLKSKKKRVHYCKSFSVESLRLYQINNDTQVIISLWSETQIAQALSIFSILKSRNPKQDVTFIGYNPIIDHYGLPRYTDSYHDIIQEGLKYQVQFNLLMPGDEDLAIVEDCDAHMMGKDHYPDGKLFQPFLTSMGCPMGCKFCTATKFLNKTVALSVEEVLEQLQDFANRGIVTLHFFDEDFLANTDRAIEILRGASKIDGMFRFVFLSTLSALNKFNANLATLEAEEKQAILDTIHLVEVGLETIDEKIGKNVGKDKPKAKLDPAKVAKEFGKPILWLTITFLPGESIASLNRTGRFLKENGLAKDKMLDRMATNGTQGGLGQFFTPYKGTGIDYDKLVSDGSFLCPDFPPMRLLPSWIPHTFLMDRFQLNENCDLIKETSKVSADIPILHEWLSLYGIELPEWLRDIKPGKEYSIITMFTGNKGNDKIINKNGTAKYWQTYTSVIAVAVMARLEIIIPTRND